MDKVKYLTTVKYSLCLFPYDTNRLYQKIVLINCIGILSIKSIGYSKTVITGIFIIRIISKYLPILITLYIFNIYSFFEKN